MIRVSLNSEPLLEALAESEHDQWSHWMQYMYDNWNEDNCTRWRRQMKTPYSELSEREKDSDRDFARKTLSILQRLGE